MRVAIIGGKLQGIEAAYLAREAGWETMVLDKNTNAPASRMCDIFVHLNSSDLGWLDWVFKKDSIIVPATENPESLERIKDWQSAVDIPVAFDTEAYAVSSSKRVSDQLFSRIGVPVPLPWPECGFPVVAKPDDGSGSEGVRVFHRLEELEQRFPGSLPPKGWVLQEYLEGPSYSLEIVGIPGQYQALQVTDLEMDARYDCKRVTAPTQLSPELAARFEEISLKIAEAVQLKGLMDVEVILHEGQLKVLEIDARLPSQTPTVVYKSTGVNILELLVSCFTQGKVFDPLFSKSGPPEALVEGAVIYEHIKVASGVLEVCGEHIMREAGPLELKQDFFGADEAITNYDPARPDWVATLIFTAPDRDAVWAKRNAVIEKIHHAARGPS